MIIETVIKGKLNRRYKRFLADVEVGGKTITVHCPNSGSMKSLIREGVDVYISKSNNPKRKLTHTLELIETKEGIACVNTMLANKLVYEGVSSKKIPIAYEKLHKEVTYGENSRVDLLAEKNGQLNFIEVKNVTLMEDNLPGVAQFPDTVTKRGQKHLRELKNEAKKGNKSTLVFVVNRTDCNEFKIAEHIDREYMQLFREAKHCGVEMLAYKTNIKAGNSAGIHIGKKLKIRD